MGNFATAFATGLMSGGMKEWIRQKDEARQNEKDARERENHDYVKEQRQRERDKNAAVDAAMKEYGDISSTGQVTQMPKMSSEMGPPPEAAPDGPGMALQMPTTRAATIADRVGALQKVALANRDMGSAERLGKERQQAADAEGDLAYARGVMENPTGDDAKKMMRMIYKKTDAFSVRHDPKTGLATVDVFSPSGDFERSVQLSPAQLGQLAVVQRKLDRGDPAALADLAAIDKSMAAAAAAEWRTKLAVVKTNNEVVKSGANMAVNQAKLGLAQNADARAADKAALERGDSARELAEKEAKSSAAVELFKQITPNATPAQIDAVRAGVIPAVPKEKPAAWKYEAGDVASALGDPAFDDVGKPVTDIMTGRQVVNRNLAREKEFVEFMAQNGIRDTNEGLMKFLARPPSMKSDSRAIALRDDAKLTRNQKRERLQKLGFKENLDEFLAGVEDPKPTGIMGMLGGLFSAPQQSSNQQGRVDSPAMPDRRSLVVGKVYDTPAGRGIWRGDRFERVPSE